jgi:hypothetical protein
MALTAKPYLRELSVRDDEDCDTSRYPFNIHWKVASIAL